MSEGGNKSYRTFPIDTVNLVTLVDNVFRGLENPNVGYEDAYVPLKMFIARIKTRHWITAEELESGLWSCNLLNEQGKFWHPQGLTFDEFLESLKIKNFKFDKKYNVLDPKGGFS